MLASHFAYRYYKSNGISDVYKLCQINESGLRLINKGLSGKIKNLVEAFFRKFTTLSDNEPRVMSISVP